MIVFITTITVHNRTFSRCLYDPLLDPAGVGRNASAAAGV